jgi:hypothetical protein
MADDQRSTEHTTKPPPDERNVGLVRELFELILHNKKWWLAPVILALLVIGALAVLGSSALAPFIYPLF